MIIKSLGRKAGQGSAGASRVFGKLIRYMNRGIEEENGKAVLWHNFYGQEGMEEAELHNVFTRNASFLKEHKRGNVLYHEMLSFSSEYLSRGARSDELERMVTDIGQEYLRNRAPKQLAYGVIHRETEHLHLHLMISANEVERRNREWLTKAEFATIQKELEAYVLARYPELGQTLIYGREAQSKERLKTQVHEQAMKSRTGAQSRKETLKNQLHQLFERAQNAEDLKRLLELDGIRVYVRGRSVGVVVREEGGLERKHRLSTLGLEAHYQATELRLTAEKVSPSQNKQNDPNKEHKDMTEQHPSKTMGGDWTDSGPSTVEIVGKEFITGKLHEAWHGGADTARTSTWARSAATSLYR
ncbi:MAG: relaxase/mobilization nuclease domain-containing protein [Burkholderiaceae bacterium]